MLLQAIDKSVYDYFSSLNKLSAGGINSSATPANPVSNVSGGALGYFSAHGERTSHKNPMSVSIVQYSKRIMWLHWITLVLGISQMITGKMLMNIEVSETKFILYAFHFGSGIAVLFFTLLRAYFFFKDPRPEKPSRLSPLHKKFINTIHIGFYVVLLALGFTGLISAIIDKYSLRQNLNPGPILVSHFALSKIFVLLFILHIAGYVQHLIKFKENRLKTISNLKP